MGNRAVERSYDAVVASPTFDYESYFNVKKGEEVLLAFILLPEEGGISDNSLHRLITVTRSGVFQSVLRTGKTKKVVDAKIAKASVADAVPRKRMFLLATIDDRIIVLETAKMTAKYDTQSEEKVTSVKMLSDGFFVYGTAAGEVWVVNPEDKTKQQIPIEASRAVTALYHSKTVLQNAILAGFEVSETASAIALFNHVVVSNPFQPGLTYQGLAGTCTDITALDAERIVLAVAAQSSEMYIWDMENCSLLLKLSLAKDTHIAKILTIGHVTPAGRMRLVCGGSHGLIIGIFQITEDNVTWTQTSKSELKSSARAKVQSGAVTSLEYDSSMNQLVYGDGKGQVWLVTGPPPASDPQASLSEPLHSDSS